MSSIINWAPLWLQMSYPQWNFWSSCFLVLTATSSLHFLDMFQYMSFSSPNFSIIMVEWHSYTVNCIEYIISIVVCINYKLDEKVTMSGGRCPLSPKDFRVTFPLGRMVTLVILQWARVILSHASGDSWRALERERREINVTYHSWHYPLQRLLWR